jgi:hypothetical protein
MSRLYIHWLNNIHELLIENIKKSQEYMSKQADKKPLHTYSFKVSDLVMLNTKNLKIQQLKKKPDHKF